jgi:hypothetical protein
MRTVAQRLILVFMLVGVLAIASTFVFRTFALFSWLLALGAIIAASIILLPQHEK